MIELSPATIGHVLALFRAEETGAAQRLLAEDCAETLPLLGRDPTPSSLERIRFAALRVSGGDLERLREAIRLARTDWRDLLVAAGFAEDPEAHLRWRARPSTREE